MIARRSAKRRNWPARLYEPRPGYYVYRHPDGRTFALGSIPLAHAIHEAMQANAHLIATQPSLVERIEGATNTLGDVLDKMPTDGAPNTVKTRRYLDKIIRDNLGEKPCHSLTVANCAEFLESKSATARTAQALRTRLVQVCRRAMHLGWMENNPADVTDTPKVKVQRGRLTMESFQEIYKVAPNVNGWLPRAMMLGLVLGADRLSLSTLQRSNVADGLLTYRRQKTGAVIAVPLALRMTAVGVSLADLVNERTGVLSPYLLHHLAPQGKASRGDPIHPDTLSQAFTDARILAKIPDEGAPTFHELRSLCKRTYQAQGGVDTKALLGHAGDRVSDLYNDPRGVEPVLVRLG